MAVNNHHEIGPTADLVSYWRGLAGIPLANQISKEADARTVSENIIRNHLQKMLPEGQEVSSEKVATVLDSMTPRGTIYIEARYKSLDQHIENSGIKQVYEVAAGICPRGINRTADSDVKYVATDLPERLPGNEGLLRNIMKNNGIARPNLYFSPVNVLDREALMEASVPLNENPIVFIAEGLFPYFFDDEKQTFGENVRYLLEQHGGVCAFSDIMYKDKLEERLSNLPSGRRVAAKMMISAISDCAGGRDVMKNAFQSEAHADKFFQDLGFKVEKLPMYDESYNLSSLQFIPEKERENAIAGMKQNKIYVLRLK